MKLSPRLLAASAVLAVFSFVILLPQCESGPCPPSDLPPNIASMCYCADSTRSDSFCSQIPHEIPLPDSLHQAGYHVMLDSLHQPYFDIFSWQSFVALNWPADAQGKPVPGTFSTDFSSPRVWEYYADPDTVFTSGTTKVPKAVWAQAHSKKKKLLYMRSKFQDIDSIGLGPNAFLESDGNALIDQNGNYAVFEEKMNPDEYNYIDTAGLRTQAGQQRWVDSLHQTIDLPEGFYTDAKHGTGGIVGAMELKASWKILVPGKDSIDRFYHQPAVIYIDSNYTTNHQPLTVEAEVGLVGLHIVHKTSQTFGQFMVWSTFEHIDNVPDNLQASQAPVSQLLHYSFYAPSILGAAVNTPPSPHPGDNVVRWSPQMPYASEYLQEVHGDNNVFTGTQAVREFPVYYYTELVNRQWRAKLAGTVWANYRLIGSQWGGTPDGPPFDTMSAPQYLGNATMETYEQQTASCITCHGSFAKIAGHGPRPKADFSFLFGHATVAEAPKIPAVKPRNTRAPKN
jgi:mono/diheme cytochrome c family protein